MAADQQSRLQLTEYDEANKVTATYIHTTATLTSQSRTDALPSTDTKPWWDSWILDVFLPAGYPHSVTDDYTEYQIYDSLQAFASSIVGLIASRAVLTSVGVGDATASTMAAVASNVLEQTAGRLATIAFAHRFGSSLEPECKMYRLLADVLNDLGFVLDCLSPALPRSMRLAVLAFSGVLRALCGVAAGSAKASLSAHFARHGNLGELNAKDSSQETVISLLGLLVGVSVVPFIVGPVLTWSAVVLLLAVHLETNRRAVRAVRMATLNRQRATLVFHALRRDHLPTPAEISAEEVIFERGGVLRDGGRRSLGHCVVGAPAQALFASLQASSSTAMAAKFTDDRLSRVIELYQQQKYILWCSRARPSWVELVIVIKDKATSRDVLQAWWQAVDVAQRAAHDHAIMDILQTASSDMDATQWSAVLHVFHSSAQTAGKLLLSYAEPLERAGWSLDASALETQAKLRIRIDS